MLVSEQDTVHKHMKLTALRSSDKRGACRLLNLLKLLRLRLHLHQIRAALKTGRVVPRNGFWTCC